MQTAGTAQYDTVQVGDATYQMPAWTIGDGFGSYVISNHFAGAIGLTLPIALALWLFATRGQLTDTIRYGGVAAAIAAAVWTTGWLADSRAGAAAVLFAGLILLRLGAEGPRSKRIFTIAFCGYATLLILFCLAFFGPWRGIQPLLPEGLQWALRTLRSDGRVAATRVAGQMLADSPLLGTGLDTFGELQPRYTGEAFMLHYAHNDYAQLLAETGLVGGCIALVLGGLLIAAGRRFQREATPPLRCLDAGPWAALSAIALHSAFDWNLHVPANALLAEVAAGLAIASVAIPPLPAVVEIGRAHV